MSDAATPISEPGLKGEVTTSSSSSGSSARSRGAAPRAGRRSRRWSSAASSTSRPLLQREAELGCGITAIVVAAAAHALRTVPRVNGSYRDGRYELYSRVNVGVTIVGDGGLRDAHDLRRRREVASRDRRELAGYFTCARARTSCIHPSSPARPSRSSTRVPTTSSRCRRWSCRPRPGRWRSGRFATCRSCATARSSPASTMQLSLSVDHRIVYGHHAAAFLEEVKAFLEEARV